MFLVLLSDLSAAWAGDVAQGLVLPGTGRGPWDGDGRGLSPTASMAHIRPPEPGVQHTQELFTSIDKQLLCGRVCLLSESSGIGNATRRAPPPQWPTEYVSTLSHTLTTTIDV